MENLMQYADELYGIALYKTRNDDMARELVQETYLCALEAMKKGVGMENPKAYLRRVLENRFNLMLRSKYKIRTISIGVLPTELADEDDGFLSVEADEDAEMIRRELAYLSKTYRETMVRYYVNNESVAEISSALGIPKGTVLSRLDAGRNIIRKGAENMKKYDEQSYNPDVLYMGMNGRPGRDNEPFSKVNGKIDKSILLLAYEKPVTTSELAQMLGVPMVFIEDSVDKLVNSELMVKQGSKVYTNFIILDDEDEMRGYKLSKEFAKDTFDEVNRIVLDMITEYRKIEGMCKFNLTQMYEYAVLNLYLNLARLHMDDDRFDTIPYSSLPERPNFGKWHIIGTRHKVSVDKSDIEKYRVSGLCIVDLPDLQDSGVEVMYEWDLYTGPTHMADFKYPLKIEERAKILISLRDGKIDSFASELIPDFIKYNFVTADGKEPSIPFLTKSEYKRVEEINISGKERILDVAGEKAIQLMLENVKQYPKHIAKENISECRYTYALENLPMAYIYEARDRGVIEIKEDKHYPVCFMVLK